MGEMKNRLKAELTSGRGTGLNWYRKLSSQHDLCKYVQGVPQQKVSTTIDACSK
jgi:hypothetical protein